MSRAIAFSNISFCPAGKIPEEAKALSLLAPSTPVPSLIPGGGLLPIPSPPALQNVSQHSIKVSKIFHDPTSSLLPFDIK